MKGFFYKYLPFVCLLAGVVACLQEDMTDVEKAIGRLSLNVIYGSLATETRAATDTVQIVGTVLLDNEMCIDAEISDLSKTLPQEETSDSLIQTRGALVGAPEDLTSMRLIMFKGAYATLPTPASFEVKGENGDFTIIKSTPNETSWPEEEPDPRSFLAFSPIDDGDIIKKIGDKEVTYTAPTNVQNQPDLCVSMFGDGNNKDLVNGKNTYRNNLTLNMQHVLTAVGFESVGWDLKITKVSITNVQNKGTVSLEDRQWTDLSGSETMEPGISSTFMKSENINQVVNITQTNGYLMMIPQEITSGMKLIIDFEGQNGQSGGQYTVNLRDIHTKWEAGKKIIYKLRLKTKPAVLTDVVNIYNFKAGYTNSTPLEIVAATDDNLTFTWDKTWLKIHRGSPGYVNPYSGGAASGWRTGINNWRNLYFFSTEENTSLYNSREAIVTVNGKKSGTRTFKVVHSKRWELKLQNEGTIYIRSFRPGSMANANSHWIEGNIPATVTYSIKADKKGNGPADRDWVTTTSNNSSGRTYVSLNHKWNPQAQIKRRATITVTASYGGHSQSKSFQVEQNASNYWIAVDGNSNFQMALYVRDLGKYYSAESYRCRNSGQGSRIPYSHEIWNIIGPAVHNNYWVNRANFKNTNMTGDDYWTDTEGSKAWGSRRFYNYRFNSGWGYGQSLWYRKNVDWYRCVHTDQSQVY